MNKKVIIIGAGIGGLSLGARLQSKGFKVEIYEKNHSIGGATNILESGNFKFDLTATISMFIKDYIDVFKYCNRNYMDYFSLITINPLYKVFYSDGKTFSFHNDLPSLCSTLNNITEGNLDNISGFFDFITSNYKKYLVAEKSFLNKPFEKGYAIFNPRVLMKALSLNPLNSSYRDCRKYISNEKLIHYLLFQTMFVGASPYASPNIYNLIPGFTQMKGLYHIKGGMYSYIKALEKLILEMGGVIKPDYPVDKILFRDNKAIGIMVNGKKILCDDVVCSCDYTYAIKTLLKDREVGSLIKPLNNLNYSCSTFILYLALDKKYPLLNIHNIYINKNFKKNTNAPFKGVFSKDPSIYIYCPSSIDSTLCPKGAECINIMVRVPNLLSTKINWDLETITSIKKKLLNILSNIRGLEDVKEHILFDSYLSPLDLRDRFNNHMGSAFGLSHLLKQSTVFRPQCELPNVENLFFTGSSVHPGNGVAMVLKSSKICGELILKKYK
ncbi:phytoene desaturase family protein [Clostridium vincentii]|uniref:Dehydrosqualene desaturase n=1 Tax=Clostridium vincentii TaxID=52704 RepID=A0A2T0BJN8_9CLOT|nr:phytoene desaturase family protein [Clostridium vincentii]PRR84067.1 Dehydrosqualene desaturase [Clostridium vincentii]